MPSDAASTCALPPIEFADLEPALADALRPRVERLGYLGEFFQRMANEPGALLAFQQFSEASVSALGSRLSELVALTTSAKLGNNYERHQHERRSLALGFGRRWVADVELQGPDGANSLSDQERDAQRVITAMLANHGHGSRSSVDAYARAYGGRAAVALLLVIGRYVTHALVVNSLELDPPVPSIFDGEDRVR